jgi:hypothetical protein
LLQLLGYNLPDARDVHAFLRSDFVAGEALPQLGENAEKALQKRRFDSRWGAERIRWTGQKIWFAGVTPWPIP